MKVKEMHPLCCMVALQTPGIRDRSPDHAPSPPVFSGGSTESTVAGILQKWTNYGKGWRSRWFLLKNGVLSYSRIRIENLNLLRQNDDVNVIGEVSCKRVSRLDSRSFRCKQQKSVAIVPLQILSFRESKSDDRRFYIFTATKTLHLRTDSKRNRAAWIQALATSGSLSQPRLLNYRLSCVPTDLSISTLKLKRRLLEEGIDEDLVKDCEQIMLSEFSELHRQLKVICKEPSDLLDTLRQLEVANIEAETSGFLDVDYRKHVLLSSGLECSTTESSDDIEKQELEEVSDEDEVYFYDTKEYFIDPTVVMRNYSEEHLVLNQFSDEFKMEANNEVSNCEHLQFERRKKLPDPVEKEKGVSLWSMIKDSMGKDLTRVCLPVYFNEPISSLQKCFEDFEYSYLLDRAYECGKSGNSLHRILYVAAFAVSGYASSDGRHCKPFNPLLGETFEADYPEKGVRFFSEKVSHHPTIIACHCEGRGWKFWGESNLRSKFWGQSIQVDPVGVLTLEFDDGEIFRWSKVTTTIYNLILGKLYCDHHGTMHIIGNKNYSCKLKFKEQSILERNPHQVNGFVEDISGRKAASVFGKWDDSIYYSYCDGTGTGKDFNSSSRATLLWRSTKPPPNLTRYNLTSFAITLNELTPGLKEKLPPTDSRLRPDQRHLENGEYEKANSEKQRLEKRQRMSRKLQEYGWKPRWFQREREEAPYRYVGGYWEAREQGHFDECPDIFGEFNELRETSEES